MHLLDVFSNPSWQHLLGALLHTIWQGAVLALLMTVVLRRIAARHHDARYLLALTAQFGLLGAGLVTWAVLDYQPPRAAASINGRIEPEAVGGPEQRRIPEATSRIPMPIDGGREIADCPRWVPIVAIGWLVGVGVMLARAARSVWSASRLARGERIGDPTILRMVERVREDLGLRRPVRVIDGGAEVGPAVLGAVWPTLVLPIAMMAGLTPESLRAILIHELAHIRRNDYVVNILQMLIEALLFFNPAAWWIGRQVRLEREACCDATAVRLTGRPVAYSRSLADWAGRLRAPAVAAAWSGDRRPSALLDRVRRVLQPADRPGVHIPLTGLLLLLLGGPLLLLGLWRGTTAAVGLVARVLSPAERVEQIKVAEKSTAPAREQGGKATLKGTVRIAGGGPPPRPIVFNYLTSRNNGSSMGTLGEFRGEFSAEISVGTTWLALDPDDYAPAIAGPFEPAASATIEGIQIVLDEGFPAHVRVTDERGQPVAGARVSGAPIIGGDGSVGRSDLGWTTDTSGIATIPHAADLLYNLSARAAGFQMMETIKATPKAEGTIDLVIRHARPARGLAVNEQGKPVAGAEVRVFREEKGSSARGYHTSGPLLATTDEAGRFELNTLEDGAVYTILVTSKAGGRAIPKPIRAGQDGIRVTIGPNLSIKGTIKGKVAPHAGDWGPPTIDVAQFVPLDGKKNEYDPVRWRFPVNAQGHFTIAKLLPSETLIEVAGRTVRVDLDRPETSVTIDLTASMPIPKQRRVTLQVVAADGAAPPTGSLEVNAQAVEGGVSWSNRELRLDDKGHAAFDAPAPGRVWFGSGSLVGYWIQSNLTEVEPGEGAQGIVISAMPAGAIVGQVLESDGQPAIAGVQLNCKTIESPPGQENQALGVAEMTTMNNPRIDGDGRFFLSPLPLGGTYAVIAGRGHNRQVSPSLRIDGTKPTGRVVLRLAPVAAAGGHVVGPDGRPLEGIPVSLKLAHPTAGITWSPPTPTDREGKFRFEDLGTEINDYRVSIDSNRDYQPVERRLHSVGPPIELHLVPGHVMEGRVLDDKTGWPIGGVAIYAHSPNWKTGERYNFDAERTTDEHGRFRFSNLPPGSWILDAKDSMSWKSSQESRTFPTDESAPIEIRGILPSWSKLKPTPLGGG